MTIRLEYSTAADTLSDFMLWKYAPVAHVEGKLRAASILFHSLEVTGADRRIFELVDTIRGGFGTLNTVWGVKKLGNQIAWEFYFYDYRLRERKRSITKFLDIIRPFAGCEVPVDENLPYFMFSIDVDERLVSGSGKVDEVHMYIGNTGSTVSSGICYSLTKGGIHLENFYYFFDPKVQMKEIVGKVSCSAYFDGSRSGLDQILWPELCNCNVIIVANKRNNDSVYFSRITIDQLVFFLRRLRYPSEICRFVEDRRPELNHQLYDVGFDYRTEGGDVMILKSGFYGLF